MKPAKLIRYVVGIAVLATLVAVMLWPAAQLVDIREVEQGAVVASIEAEGRTRLRHRYVITAPVAATTRHPALEPGDPVRAGQVLVVMDPVTSPVLDARARTQAEAEVAAAEAALAASREDTRAAEAVAAQARAEAKRLRALLERQAVAPDTAERAETESRRAERASASARFHEVTAKHQLEAAKAVLATADGGTPSDDTAVRLTSPIDGVLLQRHFDSAQPVQTGAPLCEIGNPRDMEVEVDVLSSDAVRLRPDMRVELLRWGRPEALAGRVRRVEPNAFTKFSALGVEEQRVWVMVELTSDQDQWSRLGVGYRVNARFVLREAADVVRVPTSALYSVADGTAVFVADGGRARRALVQTGIEGDGWVEVRSGLKAGDAVIAHPDRSLEDGARIRAR